jgi:hypothetical protein
MKEVGREKDKQTAANLRRDLEVRYLRKKFPHQMSLQHVIIHVVFSHVYVRILEKRAIKHCKIGSGSTSSSQLCGFQ